MIRILSYGASNTWGFKPASFNSQTGLAQRYARHERWTGILEQRHPELEIVEEGMNGRTTEHDDLRVQKPMRNGLAYLPFCLETHYPLDVVIFMLGTNDVKIQYQQSAEEIALSMEKLVRYVLASNKGQEGNAPRVLVVAPQPVVMHAQLIGQFDEDSVKKSLKLGAEYEKMCQRNGCDFLNIANVVQSSQKDGIHFELEDHQKLAAAVSEKLCVMKIV